MTRLFPFSMLLLLVFCASEIMAQRSDTLRLKHRYNAREQIFVTGDDVKLKITDQDIRKVRGKIVRIEDNKLYLTTAVVPLQNIRMILPMDSGQPVMRTVSDGMLGSISLWLLSAPIFGEPALLIPVAPLLVSGTALGKDRRFDVIDHWTIEGFEEKPDTSQPEEKKGRETLTQLRERRAQQKEERASKTPEHHNIPDMQLRCDIIQSVMKEINVALEKRVDEHKALEFGIGFVHPGISGDLLTSTGYRGLDVYAHGVSGRIARKWYIPRPDSREKIYYALEFKYRHQRDLNGNLSSRVANTFGLEYSHFRHEFQVLAKHGFLALGRKANHFDFFVGLGPSLQYRGTRYRNCTSCGREDVNPLSIRFNTADNGWVIAPRFQAGISYVFGWNRADNKSTVVPSLND